jgi:hypothetical protein
MKAKKYVQSHTVFEDAGNQIRTTRPKMHETCDGITEVWWDTLEDFSGGGAVQERAEAARSLLEDESRALIDLPDRRARNLRLHQVGAPEARDPSLRSG